MTGFDAPRKSVMYFDNLLKEHNLLQAMPTAGYAYARIVS
ncbi:type I restriction enzyme subunit R domain-containing protein [Nostoc sp.]